MKRPGQGRRRGPSVRAESGGTGRRQDARPEQGCGGSASNQTGCDPLQKTQTGLQENGKIQKFQNQAKAKQIENHRHISRTLLCSSRLS